MKIFLLHDRKNNVHLVDFTTYNGKIWTFCGKIYNKTNIVNFLALDAPLHLVCRECYEACATDMFLDWDCRLPANCHINLNRSLPHPVKPLDAKFKYENLEHREFWTKLKRYQKLTDREPIKK